MAKARAKKVVRANGLGAGPRREQVLRVAEELFAQQGYHGVGLREIAARVGIRAPSLFKHFAGKRELYNAVLLSIFERLTEVAGRLEQPGPFAPRLEAYLNGYIDLVSSDPHVVPLLFREMLDRTEAMRAATRARAFEIYRRVDAFLQAGQHAGAFRDIDRASLHLTLSGAILYHALAARPYQSAVEGRARPLDVAVWKRTVLATARALLFQGER
jgi:AcrR family transcriptional regulator